MKRKMEITVAPNGTLLVERMYSKRQDANGRWIDWTVLGRSSHDTFPMHLVAQYADSHQVVVNGSKALGAQARARHGLVGGMGKLLDRN